MYVDRDDTADSIYNKVKAKGHPGNLTGFRWMAKYRELEKPSTPAAMPFVPERMYTMFTAGYPVVIK